jgi:2-polyprenyl-6-methoxyphenol hydroxylase-like FAD-dependent oxidoreductase
VRRDALRDARTDAAGGSAGAAVEELLRRSCAGVRRALDGAERVGTWLSVGPIRPGRRALWSEPGGFAVGNAAGEAHPILGEGMSMAIQGAFLLCARLELERNALLSGERQDRSARLYELDWRRAFGARIRWAALFAALAMRPAARALLPALKVWPALLTAGAIVGGKARAAPVASRSTRTRASERSETGSRAKVASAPAAHR